MGYRLSEKEKKALKSALQDFEGEVYLFGSRLDPHKRGGDIDILLRPRRKTGRYELKTQIVSRFQRALEQSLDVVVYDDQNVFCQEIIKHAQPLDPASL
jgi:predicted nucleotidyltransferase